MPEPTTPAVLWGEAPARTPAATAERAGEHTLVCGVYAGRDWMKAAGDGSGAGVTGNGSGAGGRTWPATVARSGWVTAIGGGASRRA